MQEIVIRFGERLIDVHLAEANDVLPQPSTDGVATVPPEPGSQNDAAGQLESLSAALDELRRQLAARTSSTDEATTTGEPTDSEDQSDPRDCPRPEAEAAADDQDGISLLDAEPEDAP